MSTTWASDRYCVRRNKFGYIAHPSFVDLQPYSMRPFLLAFLLLFGNAVVAQSEADHVNAIAAAWEAETEVKVTSGRVDIQTAQHAIEVEWANKWKYSIGQALWYGLQTNRQAGIILLLRNKADYKYYLQRNSALQHADLAGRIQVWVYPNDFPGVQVAAPISRIPADAASGTYWLSINSNKRHKSSCRWYTKSKGRFCTADEGTLAKCCY